MEPAGTEPAGGGDPACWAHLVCPECGAIETEGHRAGCRSEQQGGSDADPTRVVERPAHGFRVVEVAQIFYDQHHRAGELLAVAELAESWHRWARRVLSPAG